MLTASSSILSAFRFCAGAHSTSPAILLCPCPRMYHTLLCRDPLLSLTSPRNNTCSTTLNHRSHFHPFISAASSRNDTETSPPQKFALLLEVEGVLIDVSRVGNRQAFNAAFRKLGLDCANWSQPVYSDLVRKSAGDEERMLILFFNRIGWPTSVPTSEKGAFLKTVLREKKNALEDLVMSKAFSLRPGAEEFIDDAFKEEVPVVIFTAYSGGGEKVARSIVEKLGSDRMSKIKIVGDDEVKQSFYGQLVFGKGVSSSLDELLAEEVRKSASAEKQKIAEEVASMLKLKVDLNTSSSESLKKIVAALRAGAEYAGLPVSNCILVAGSQVGVAAAARISMPCVVLRSSSTSRAEFGSAVSTMDGFGGADLSISRLRRKFLPED
ncbi:CBBY-like protein [Andrographis paniculata]|uniref:CBBY-like protein n=1 Tax=Andrographis paniculata TaxID=175694 RepID=UPI0021E7A489|nr:CBBY-like protein [Andrographis paniculata]